MYTIEQENDLIQQAKNGQTEACEKLLLAYAALLKKMARRYQHTACGQELKDEASGILHLTFMEAVYDFDHSAQVNFAAFLQSRLHGAMYKAFRRTVSYNQHTLHPASADDEKTPWYNLINSHTPSPEQIVCSRDELEGIYRQLSASEQQLLGLIYCQELPQTAVAKILHLSPQTVSKRKQRLFDKIKKLA